MQLKNRRNFTLIEMLEKTLALVPIEQRFGLAIEFSTSQEILKKNLEAIYTITTQRLLHLSYYLDWSRTIDCSKEFRPKAFGIESSDYLPASFHDLKAMTSEETGFFNASFADWINNQVVRELNEFLKTYLLELNEVCTVLERTKVPIKASDVVEIKKKCQAFEKGGMKERLAILRRDFGFILTHHQQVLSLYELRNIFSHFDGVVTKKFCDQNGNLEVSWPKNNYKLKKRGKDEWVPYHKIQKPFSSELYENIQISWLSKSETRTYRAQDQIKLSYKDLNDLLFFYLFVFNELHKSLVAHVKDQGFKVRPFEKYMIVLGGLYFSSSDED